MSVCVYVWQTLFVWMWDYPQKEPCIQREYFRWQFLVRPWHWRKWQLESLDTWSANQASICQNCQVLPHRSLPHHTPCHNISSWYLWSCGKHIWQFYLSDFVSQININLGKLCYICRWLKSWCWTVSSLVVCPSLGFSQPAKLAASASGAGRLPEKGFRPLLVISRPATTPPLRLSSLYSSYYPSWNPSFCSFFHREKLYFVSSIAFYYQYDVYCVAVEWDGKADIGGWW